jgi:SAM-dependent methyltransferase
MQATAIGRRWYPTARPDRQPSPWWYYGRAIYVSRRDYFKIYIALLCGVGIPFVLLGLALGSRFWLVSAFGMGTAALLYEGYSLLGMFRMYGPPSSGYLRQVLRRAGIAGPVAVADFHIGTYRHSFALADLLPEATIDSVDCWDPGGPPAEEAIRDVRELEPRPSGHARIRPAMAVGFRVPLPDASLDAVVFGFGTHEIAEGEPRSMIFLEAKRILRPSGKVVIFEHGNDFHNTIIFGPVIGHVTTREGWMATLSPHFGELGYARSWHAVDLFWGTKGARVGTLETPLPRTSARLATLKVLGVIGAVTCLTLVITTALPDSWLAPSLLGITILGLAWPWIMIGVALVLDAACRRPDPRVS